MSDAAVEPDLDEQPLPPTKCPECGGEPSDEIIHRLSAMGYSHDDQHVVCVDCGHRWTCGVPIGEFDRPEMAADLECSCGHWRLVHRAQITDAGNVALHLKCPECYHFEIVSRETDADGIALVGYPQISGQTEGCDPYGYPDPDPDLE